MPAINPVLSIKFELVFLNVYGVLDYRNCIFWQRRIESEKLCYMT